MYVFFLGSCFCSSAAPKLSISTEINCPMCSNMQRQRLQHYLSERQIETATHYVPLHSSQAGKRYGNFCGQDNFTTLESQRLLRLPLFYGLSK